MDFDAAFNAQLNQLKEEGNYRIFAELERKCGHHPRADNHGPDGKREITELDAMIAYMQMLGTLVDFSTYEAEANYR